MDAFLNTYAYLIISVISFVAPVVIFLLNVFHEGIAHLTKQHAEEEKQIQELLRVQINDKGSNFNVLVNSSNESLKKNQRKQKKIRNRLNPKRQIRLLFIPLFVSLLLIMSAFLIKGNCWGYYNRWLLLSVIALSFVGFGMALYVLGNTIWAIIEAKKSIDENRGAVSLSSANDIK